MQKTLRDRNGNVVGYEDNFNGEKVVRDRSGNLRGRFDNKSDRTRDASGDLAGFGDHSRRLID